MSYRVTAHINLSALRHNLARVKTFAPHSAVMAMVKADAYGHGLLRVAPALAAADALGVARLEEALELYEAGNTIPIVIMSGYLGAAELKKMVQYNIAAAIHTEEQVKLLEQTSLEQPLQVWLKIDTGMHRLGFSAAEVPAIYQRLMASAKVKKPIGVMTHFAQADQIDNPITQQQINLFQQTANTIHAELRSMANSAAIIRGLTNTRDIEDLTNTKDWVRPGIMLYGVSPFLGHNGQEYGLQPVMTLKSQIIAIHDLQKDDAVGYGGTWVCPKEMRIGVVAVGYGDGYPRHADNNTPVLVNGVRCHLAGRVSMDLMTIDLSQCPQAKIGDSVILWGADLPIEEVAYCAETIAYELLCHMTRRVNFITF